MSRERRERTTPLMMGRVLDQQDSLDGTPARVFSKGDEHERRAWDEILPLDDELEARRYRGSVPRSRSALLALVMLCIFVALGAAAGGFALFAKGDFRSWLKVMSHESAATSPPKQTPPEAPRTEPQPLAQPPAQPVPQPVAQPRVPTQAPAEVPAAPPKKAAAVASPDPEAAERLRQDAIAVRRRRQQRHSERDYVWSQELNALVPAASLERPLVQPNVAPTR